MAALSARGNPLRGPLMPSPHDHEFEDHELKSSKTMNLKTPKLRKEGFPEGSNCSGRVPRKAPDTSTIVERFPSSRVRTCPRVAWRHRTQARYKSWEDGLGTLGGPFAGTRAAKPPRP